MAVLKIGSVRGGFVLMFTVAIFGTPVTVQPSVTAAPSCLPDCSPRPRRRHAAPGSHSRPRTCRTFRPSHARAAAMPAECR
jgi:hypothetical protein